nr:MAG TPA: hypothetical protein [Caudoviricetes sp.]
MAEDYVEVLVAIGRIEEGIKSVREGMDRLERKSDAQDLEIRVVKDDLQDVQLEIQKLKTQRSTAKENVALLFASIAFIAAVINIVSSNLTV